jgi:hypothetical protein
LTIILQNFDKHEHDGNKKKTKTKLLQYFDKTSTEMNMNTLQKQDCDNTFTKLVQHENEH